MALAETKKQRFGMFLMNPMVKKLDKVEEKGDTSATYSGITWKTIFLLILTVLGCAIFFLTNDMVPASYVQEIEGFKVNMVEAGIVIGSLLLALFFPLIAFKFVRSSMILGSLYSIIQGYALAFVAHLVGNDFVFPAMIALGITILVVIVMLVIYKLKLININRKFVSVISTVFFTELFLGIVLFALSFVPATKEFVTFITDNGIITMCISAIGIAIACLFLLVDFEVINHCVDEKLAKKYEWLAAFALSFSIIEIYLKILNMILRLMQKKETAN